MLERLKSIPPWVWFLVAGVVVGVVVAVVVGRLEAGAAATAAAVEAARRSRRGKRQRDAAERDAVDDANHRARALEDRFLVAVDRVDDLVELDDAERRRRLEDLAAKSNRRRGGR